MLFEPGDLVVRKESLIGEVVAKVEHANPSGSMSIRWPNGAQGTVLQTNYRSACPYGPCRSAMCAEFAPRDCDQERCRSVV